MMAQLYDIFILLTFKCKEKSDNQVIFKNIMKIWLIYALSNASFSKLIP